MTIFELLKKDHEEAIKLFDQLDELEGASGSESKAQQLFSQLSRELQIHMEGEEKLFYPSLKDEEETHTMILEAIEEHHVIKLLLREMSSMQQGEQWFAKLTVLRENVEHHVDEEEGELFDEARDILDESQTSEMAKSMEEMKRSQMAAAGR
ncbi:MAG: hemerythrin domain-containing protein [Nitrospirota bacterium]